MNKTPPFRLAALGLLLPLLSACGRPNAPETPSTPASANSAPQTVLGKTIDGALRRVQRQLETGNLDLGTGVKVAVDAQGRTVRNGNSTDGSKAQLTPKGDLLIDGRPVPVTPQQRALLLDYRKQVLAMAATGMALGVQGADLAGTSVLETLSGLMRGNVADAGKRIDTAGQRIAGGARQICAQLSALLESRQRLAAALPAFRPYATTTRTDTGDCMKDAAAAVTST